MKCAHRRNPLFPVTLALCLAVLGIGQPGSAHAAEPPAKAEPVAAEPSKAEPAKAAAPATGGDDFNFDLMGETPKSPQQQKEEQEKAAAIERTGKIRRSLLTTHQIVGFVALAALTATVVVGQLNHYDMYLSGDQTGRYRSAHLGLSIGTSALFAGTGFMGVFAPNPYPKPIRFDTALLHKVSMILATAGMATQIILGPITADRAGRTDQARLALGHVITGYATWAFMTTGMIAYMF